MLFRHRPEKKQLATDLGTPTGRFGIKNCEFWDPFCDDLSTSFENVDTLKTSYFTMILGFHGLPEGSEIAPKSALGRLLGPKIGLEGTS